MTDEMFKHSKKRSLFGQYMQQTWPSIWLMERMLFEFKPDRIVELGSGNGVLSGYFAMYVMMSKNTSFMTIDLDTSKSAIAHLNIQNVNLLQGDIHSQNIINHVANFINGGNKSFLLVDGMDPKSDEVNMYAPHTKTGTIIFSHDAILTNSKSNHKWGYTEDKINWTQVDRLEPYYTWAVDMDTRMLPMVKK